MRLFEEISQNKISALCWRSSKISPNPKLRISIFLFTIFTLFYSELKAQTYIIESLDGASTKINLSHEIASGTLAISCQHDSLFIDEYLYIHKVHVLNKKFLQIIYEARGGSDQDLMYMVLLCVNKGKLYPAMNTRSFLSYDLNQEHGLFEIKLKLTENNKLNFKLQVSTHVESASKRDPKTDHNYNTVAVLTFDTTQNVFYSSYKSISQYFIIHSPLSNTGIRKHILGRFPTITIDKIDYYFIKGNWYERGNENHLLAYTCRK